MMTTVELTNKQREIILHALGLTRHRAPPHCRGRAAVCGGLRCGSHGGCFLTESQRLLHIIRCRCKVTAHDGCWTWQGATTGVHPQMSWKGRGGQMVRRLAYQAHFGVTLGELRVSPNNCGNVLCVNPEHLTCWSRSEHLREQHRSGSRSTPMHYIHRVEALKRKGRVKLDLEKAREIRASSESCKDLAERYGVHLRTISAVRCGRIWKDINALGNIFGARTLTSNANGT